MARNDDLIFTNFPFSCDKQQTLPLTHAQHTKSAPTVHADPKIGDSIAYFQIIVPLFASTQKHEPTIEATYILSLWQTGFEAIPASKCVFHKSLPLLKKYLVNEQKEIMVY